ncbi:hypothetical protein M407DRAFT_243585 [Tulasnella calospora MUT 4182]|uniref:Uncharacterized protein n=1 Tax=Tulasnella calospora MUT 4182 TaxID=1051891 RepID=A0A0C3QIM5_9AGAM|nr:hypothetical protein M407DRAFT_243585 [Tulasnella calospora MUT 4182]
MLDPASAGALFGLVCTAASLGDGMAPEIVGHAATRYLFALSIETRLLGGNLVWIVMTCVSVLAAVFAQNLKGRI